MSNSCFWTQLVNASQECGKQPSGDPVYFISPYGNVPEPGQFIYIYPIDAEPDLGLSPITISHIGGDFVGELVSEDGIYWAYSDIAGTFPPFVTNGPTDELFTIVQGGETFIGQLQWSLS